MYTLLRLLPIKQLAYEQLPALASAWCLAELFYKFHSFTLECAAFLATWFLFDVTIQWVSRQLGRTPGLRPKMNLSQEVPGGTDPSGR